MTGQGKKSHRAESRHYEDKEEALQQQRNVVTEFNRKADLYPDQVDSHHNGRVWELRNIAFNRAVHLSPDILTGWTGPPSSQLESCSGLIRINLHNISHFLQLTNTTTHSTGIEGYC